jgi:hypothetical protein
MTDLGLVQRFLNTFKPVEILFFELCRRKAVGITLAAFRIVEHLDVIEDITPSRSST